MKRIILTLILLLPLYSIAQDLKKSDLFGEWKFKEMILISETGRDSIKKQLRLMAEFEDKDFELIITPSDMKFTESEFYVKNEKSEFELSSDYWTVTENNGILIHRLVPEDMLDHYIKYSFNVIEKLDNEKYYYQNPEQIKLIAFDKSKIIYKDIGYEYIFERN
ncbi:hypothetical protein H7F37_01270 [Winogradskyella sp. PAMC22761]|nr:hypothetical protein H7F37_01270 [Winogradskyella sp. PAMC22761]